MRAEVEQVVDGLLEQEPPSFDQLDLGPAPLPDQPRGTLEVLVSIGGVPIREPDLVHMTNRSRMVVMSNLRYWLIRGFVQEDRPGYWSATSRGADYIRGHEPQEDIEEPDFDQLDLGPEPEPEPDVRVLGSVLSILVRAGEPVSFANLVIRRGESISSVQYYLRRWARRGYVEQPRRGWWKATTAGINYHFGQRDLNYPTEDMEELDFDQLDLGPEAKAKPLERSTLSALVSAHGALVNVQHLARKIEEPLDLVLLRLEFWRERGMARQSRTGWWRATPAGIEYARRVTQAQEDIEEPDFDQVDFGSEVLPTDFEPSIDQWKGRADDQIHMPDERRALDYLKWRYGGDVRMTEAAPDAVFFGLGEETVGMYDPVAEILYTYQYMYPEAG